MEVAPIDIAAMLGGLADLAWPFVVALALFLFRSEIAGLIRSKDFKLKYKDWEITAEEFQRLEQGMNKLEEESKKALPAEDPSSLDLTDFREQKARISAMSDEYPRAALLMVWALLEKEFAELLGDDMPRHQVPLFFRRWGLDNFPSALVEQFDRLRRIRNAVAHGFDDFTTDQVRDAIDAGLRLLRMLHEFEHVAIEKEDD